MATNQAPAQQKKGAVKLPSHKGNAFGGNVKIENKPGNSTTGKEG